MGKRKMREAECIVDKMITEILSKKKPEQTSKWEIKWNLEYDYTRQRTQDIQRPWTGNKLVTFKERNNTSRVLVQGVSRRMVEAYVKEVARIQVILILLSEYGLGILFSLW